MIAASPNPSMEECLTLKQAAHRLGVHYMTAYRYVRQGRLAADRVGTAWCIRATDLADFSRSTLPASNQTVASPAAASSATVDWAARLRGPLAAGDERAGWAVIEAALAAGASPVSCCTQLIGRTAAAITDDPGGSTTAAADVHLSSVVAFRLVAHIGARFRRPGQTRGTVVLGGAMGEHRGLPLAIVATVLRLDRFRVLELGTNVPVDAFVLASRAATRCSAVGIWVGDGSGSCARESAVNTQAALRRTVPDLPVVIGGRAFDDGRPSTDGEPDLIQRIIETSGA